MRYLLDTNATLFALREPEKLSKRALEVMSDLDNDLVVPVCVPWELAIKCRKGRLPEAEPILADYPRYLREISAVSMPIEYHHAIFAGGMEWDHADPFDRMVVAISILENMPLISSDSVLKHAPQDLNLVW